MLRNYFTCDGNYVKDGVTDGLNLSNKTINVFIIECIFRKYFIKQILSLMLYMNISQYKQITVSVTCVRIIIACQNFIYFIVYKQYLGCNPTHCSISRMYLYNVTQNFENPLRIIFLRTLIIILMKLYSKSILPNIVANI